MGLVRCSKKVPGRGLGVEKGLMFLDGRLQGFYYDCHCTYPCCHSTSPFTYCTDPCYHHAGSAQCEGLNALLGVGSL
jgi:hypothetical protein